MYHTSVTRTLVATVSDRRRCFAVLAPHPGRFRIRKLLRRAVLARVGKERGKHERTDPCPHITPNAWYCRLFVPLEARLSMFAVLASGIARENAVQSLVSKALAMKTGKLRTWRSSIDSHSLCLLVCSILTPQIPRSLEQTLLLVPIDRPRIRSEACATDMC
jgi:hypothetical protein